jgi:hypothetical protein
VIPLQTEAYAKLRGRNRFGKLAPRPHRSRSVGGGTRERTFVVATEQVRTRRSVASFFLRLHERTKHEPNGFRSVLYFIGCSREPPGFFAANLGQSCGGREGYVAQSSPICYVTVNLHGGPDGAAMPIGTFSRRRESELDRSGHTRERDDSTVLPCPRRMRSFVLSS